MSGYEGDSLVGAGILTKDEAIALINDLDNLLAHALRAPRQGCDIAWKHAWHIVPSNPSAKAIELMRKLGTWKD